MTGRHHDNAPDEILARLNPGQVYESGPIAGKFGNNVAQVMSILEALVDAGRLKRGTKRHSGRQYAGYVRMSDVEIELRDTTTIAGPAYTPNWRSTLTGYDSANRERQALCMLARSR
ncbi:hypothetical protein [Burkholderia pyrrocinia]|uniref:hypothetical protein n=1 Tax=Burkholderia pyrrocinia TaxID=60550 RepID=UPI001BCDEACC|nr:hypothetical protein [Burkholderia pyrrocinia]QVN19424.1 hypothetical protein JYG32_06815 [Burkholderia pyrrocinia]